MKVRRGSIIVDKNKSKRGVMKRRKKSVEYSDIGCKVVATFIIIFRMCKRECV